jgi:hypothetical protein
MTRRCILGSHNRDNTSLFWYSHRQRLEVEDPSCEHLYLAKDKTLQDLIYDMSTSGSGSGE